MFGRTAKMNETLNFVDIFKKSFLESTSGDITVVSMLMTLGLTFALGVFVYFIYKRTYSGVLFSRNFSISIIAIAMITSLVIIAVTSNIILSLGMVGALSIVRFRTAIKDPGDIVYMYWAIGIGIVTGAGIYSLAIYGSLTIGIMLMIFSKVTSPDNTYLLVINCQNPDAEKNALSFISKSLIKYKIKSKSSKADVIETTIELKLKSQNMSFVDDVNRIEGMNHAVLVSYNGDYVS